MQYIFTFSNNESLNLKVYTEIPVYPELSDSWDDFQFTKRLETISVTHEKLMFFSVLRKVGDTFLRNMYGTVFYMKPKPGKEQEVRRIFEEWEAERKPMVKGAKAGYLYQLDKGGMMGVAVFESKEDYKANAEDPGQNEWYMKLRENLEEDPEWNDGEVILMS